MFIEQLNKEDAQNLANWLYADEEACYYPENAKFDKYKNGHLILTCDGYQKGEKHELVLFDFTLWDYSDIKYKDLVDHYTKYMVNRFGRKYLSAYHKYIDNELESYATET